jgi:hypothetical protein
MNKRLLFAFIIVLVLVGGCAVDPEDMSIETREVSNFDRVSFSGIGALVIVQGDQESLTIEAPSEIMDRIEIEVSDGTLRIGFESGFLPPIPPPPILYGLSVREITGLELSGAGSINASSIDSDHLELVLGGAGAMTIDSLAAERVEVVLSGLGSINLTGQVKQQEIVLTTAGAYRAGDLESQSATIALKGAGSATVWATNVLNVSISGVGTVSYYGDPSVTQNVTGVGSVRSLGEH